jgi:alpha-L-arabinofuranosidase
MHSLSNNSLLAVLLLLMACSGQKEEININPEIKFGAEYSMVLNEESRSLISPHLMGFNIVYAYEADTLWTDGNIETYLKEVNASVLRYPGGTVSTYYHWNQLTGEGWKDSWDPQNPIISKDSSEFMTLDQYISLIRNTNATPLLGINMCSGWRWNRIEDGIEEALALMKYCKDRNFDVTYWYLGNEPYQHDSNGGSKTVEQYAELINLFASRMKEVNPNIKIVANWNAAFKNRKNDYQVLLTLAGKNIDIVDVHWYWSWSEPTWDKWLSKTPLQQWTGETYLEDIQFFRELTKDLGFEHMKLASLEWNVGPIRNNQLTPHQIALIQSDMLLNFMTGGLDMATFWPIHGPGASVAARSFVNRADRKPHPNYQIFKFVGELQGNYIYDYETGKELPDVNGIIVGNTKEETFWICLLNKNNFDVKVDISTRQFRKFKPEEASVFILRNEGNNSELVPLSNIHSNKNGISFISPGYSFSMMKISK